MVKKLKKHRFALLTFLGVLLFAFNAYSTDLFFKSETYGQIWNNQLDDVELPFSEYFYFNIHESKIYTGFDLDLEVKGDAIFGEGDFKLFNAYFRFGNEYSPVKGRLGRIPVIDGFSYNLIDGGELLVEPDIPVRLAISTGVSRKTDESDFEQGNYIAQAKIALNRIRHIDAGFNFIYEYDIDKELSWVKVGADANARIPYAPYPEFYFITAYNPTYNILEEITGGVTIFPIPYLHADFSISRFNTQGEDEIASDDILRYFSQDAELIFTETVTIYTCDYLFLFEEFALSYFDSNPYETHYGKFVKAGFEVTTPARNLSVIPTFQYNNSYGGIAYGFDIAGKYQPINLIDLNASVGFIRFDKITNEISNATYSKLGGGIHILKGLRIGADIEINSNDEFKNDVRGIFNITYKYF